MARVTVFLTTDKPQTTPIRDTNDRTRYVWVNIQTGCMYTFDLSDLDWFCGTYVGIHTPNDTEVIQRIMEIWANTYS